ISGDGASLELRENLKGLREKLETEQETLLQAEREKSLSEEKLAERKRILIETREELKDKKSRLKELNSELRELAKNRKNAEENLQEYILTKKATIEGLIDVRKEIDKLATAYEVKVREFERLKAKCDAIEEAGEKNFSRAIAEILKLRDEKRIGGILGTISELGRVDPKFSKALAAAVGGGLNFIVVKNEDVAEECIVYLKKNRSGRCTFLPLNKLKATKPNAEQQAIAKHAYGFALNLVEYDSKFKPAFAYVFRNTVVVRDIAFAKKNIGRARMVTLDGDLVEASGAMSGGYYKPSGGFEAVNAAKKKLETLGHDIERLEKEKAELRKQEEELKTSLEEISSSELELEREKELLRERLNSRGDTVEELTTLLAKKEAFAREISASITEAEGIIKKAGERIRIASAGILSLKGEKEALEKELDVSREEKVLKEIKELETRLLELETEREGKKGRISLNESEVQKVLHPKFLALKKSLLDIFYSKKKAAKELSGIGAKKSELEASLAKLKEKEKGVTGEIRALRDKREFFIKGLQAIERKREELKEKHLDIRRTMEDSRIEKARHETKLEDVEHAVKAYADLEIELIAPMDIAELEKEIVRMEVEIEALEPINMRAVEEYGEVKEKFDTLSSRVEKLGEEKEAILKLMEEIDHRKKSIFMEVFENIALNFRHIFSQLSDGGEADFLLEDEKPLEGGLQIRAKPAGKNTQYIELMSGGEKTLTALAFIFAVQHYQPAPFYILDEVDMYLDDTNLTRVSELIMESSKRAQFIVVSLREDLMTSADQLFGVTNEDGISKIIGVELQESGDASS
ncbi:MAG: hypothetical protein V3T58_03585, partial [Candidatus Hydrothermarchaeales archaeon]